MAGSSEQDEAHSGSIKDGKLIDCVGASFSRRLCSMEPDNSKTED